MRKKHPEGNSSILALRWLTRARTCQGGVRANMAVQREQFPVTRHFLLTTRRNRNWRFRSVLFCDHSKSIPRYRAPQITTWTESTDASAMGAGSSTEAEREPLLSPSPVETNSRPVNGRVYTRRWLVLTLFSTLGFMQGMVWNFWGPIQNSAVHAYGFTKSDIAVLVLWGPLGFIPWLLFMWLLDKKGELRVPFGSGSLTGKSPRVLQLWIFFY